MDERKDNINIYFTKRGSLAAARDPIVREVRSGADLRAATVTLCILWSLRDHTAQRALSTSAAKLHPLYLCAPGDSKRAAPSDPLAKPKAFFYFFFSLVTLSRNPRRV